MIPSIYDKTALSINHLTTNCCSFKPIIPTSETQQSGNTTWHRLPVVLGLQLSCATLKSVPFCYRAIVVKDTFFVRYFTELYTLGAQSSIPDNWMSGLIVFILIRTNYTLVPRRSHTHYGKLGWISQTFMLGAEIGSFAEPWGQVGNILFTLKKAFMNAKIGL